LIQSVSGLRVSFGCIVVPLLFVPASTAVAKEVSVTGDMTLEKGARPPAGSLEKRRRGGDVKAIHTSRTSTRS